MKLIEDWQKVCQRAWSVRLAIAAAALSAAEVVVTLLTPDRPSPWFAALAGLVCMAAAVARVVSQPKLWSDDESSQ